MKKIRKKFLCLILSLVTLFSIIPMQSSAKTVSLDLPDLVRLTLYSSKDVDPWTKVSLNKTFLTQITGTVSNLKSSNTSVVKTSKSVAKYGSTSYTSIYLTAKKAGSATVSFKSGGQTYKVKVTVTKYKNPISSIKIGSTTLSSSKFKSSATYKLSYSKFKNKSVKVTIKLKSGWTLGDEYNPGYIYYAQKSWAKTDLLKNNKKVTIKGGKGFFFEIVVKNKTSGREETILISFS